MSPDRDGRCYWRCKKIPCHAESGTRKEIRKGKDRETTDPECLHMDIFSVNSTIGPGGL